MIKYKKAKYKIHKNKNSDCEIKCSEATFSMPLRLELLDRGRSYSTTFDQQSWWFNRSTHLILCGYWDNPQPREISRQICHSFEPLTQLGPYRFTSYFLLQALTANVLSLVYKSHLKAKMSVTVADWERCLYMQKVSCKLSSAVSLNHEWHTYRWCELLSNVATKMALSSLSGK